MASPGAHGQEVLSGEDVVWLCRGTPHGVSSRPADSTSAGTTVPEPEKTLDSTNSLMQWETCENTVKEYLQRTL